MKKKRQRDGTNLVAFVIGVRVFPGLLLLLGRRRRLLYYHLLPFLAAVVACLLLLIAFTLFLCPQNNTGHPHRLNPLVVGSGCPQIYYPFYLFIYFNFFWGRITSFLLD